MMTVIEDKNSRRSVSPGTCGSVGFLWRASFCFLIFSGCFIPDVRAETYEYDNANRLTRVTYADGSYEAYDYDSRGNIVKVIRRPPALPDIEINPESLEFLEVSVGEAGEKIIEVTNSGAAPLSIDRINLPEPPFVVSQDGCTGTILLSEEPCQIEVSYTPQTPGPSMDTLSIESNDPLDPVLVVQLSGAGIGGDAPSSIAGLSQSVEALGLTAGQTQALNASLENALAALAKENANSPRVAANKLRAFINKVQAASGKTISESDALALIASTEQIIALLEDTEA